MTSRRLLLSSIVLALGACTTPPPANDAGELDAATDDAPAIDAFVLDTNPHMGLLYPACDDTDPAPAMALPHYPSTLVGTYVPHVDRVTSAGPLNPAGEMGEAMYRAMGMHVVDTGPGQAHVTRTDLGATSSATTGRHSLAWMAHLSDFQLVDDESPARLARTDNALISGGLRAQEAYLPRAVSAMNRTFARISATRAFDIGIVTGDCADSAQTNELDWVLQLMNGGAGLHTDSGHDDDLIPGPGNDAKDPFDPVAFPGPWLYVPGNHDVEVVGVNTPNDALRAQALGTRAITGTRDYRVWYAPVTTGDVVPDPMRAIVDRDQIVAAVRASTAEGPHGPLGHGYPASGMVDTSLGANWSHDVVPGVLRIVSIDTSDRTGGSSGMVMQSTIDGWLLPELARAEMDGVVVMLASHHSTRSIDTIQGEVGSTVVPGALSGSAIEQIVAMHPVVVAWLVGHTHDNRIRPVAGPDAAHPGYWEIMTSAIADWPSQARTVELVDNGDGTLSIFATLVDYDTDDCFERRFRALTQMEWSSAWSDDRTRDAPNHNVELVVALPASATAAVTAARATAPTRIESLTTLMGM